MSISALHEKPCIAIFPVGQHQMPFNGSPGGLCRVYFARSSAVAANVILGLLHRVAYRIYHPGSTICREHQVHQKRMRVGCGDLPLDRRSLQASEDWRMRELTTPGEVGGVQPSKTSMHIPSMKAARQQGQSRSQEHLPDSQVPGVPKVVSENICFLSSCAKKRSQR